ncbi:ArsR/SmtB family transcription factor [Amycolatopsis sp. GM8]|uniref:ArsR/SmtB family transcription factor n=1 Tax=Amycolatopsis sp. GM8 TaxID=2896530 RepID=UPI0035ABFE9C
MFAGLSDESRLTVVRLLLDGELRTAGAIAELVSPPTSTCSYHLSKLLSLCCAARSSTISFPGFLTLSGRPHSWTPNRLGTEGRSPGVRT